MDDQTNKKSFFEFMISPKGLVTGIIGICLLITIIITITAFIVSLSVEKTEPLSSPHVIVDENVLRWGRVKNAKEYIIYVNGEEKETTPLNSYYFIIKGIILSK